MRPHLDVSADPFVPRRSASVPGTSRGRVLVLGEDAFVNQVALVRWDERLSARARCAYRLTILTPTPSGRNSTGLVTALQL